MKNLVISVPRLEIHRPPISTAIVAETIRLEGEEVEALDLNCDFFHYLPDRQTYYNYDEIWDRQRSPKLSEIKNIITFIKSKFAKMDNYDRYWISVFGSSGTLFTNILCKMIKKYLKNKYVILGGQGVQDMDILDRNNLFGSAMMKSGLCDMFITGEGEKIIKKVLEGKSDGPGINNSNALQIDDIDQLPFPNYGFYDLDRYDYLSKNKEVFIVGSRGCVRRCTYCDVARYWPKFRYRSGGNIAEEMINHYEKHGVTNFYFTDSLINGSMKAFNDMCEQLARYNTQHKAGFSWKGQFIFRPKNQLPDDHFATVAAAGGEEFYVGLETGSDKIRWEMDKKFTNEDVDFQLEEFNKHGISVFFLMLIGYVTETLNDHQETLKMFKRWQKYVATGTIKGIDLGVGLKFLAHTPLEKQIDQHEVYFLKGKSLTGSVQNSDLWQSNKNPELDVPERIRRRIETHEEAIKYNWPIWRGVQRLNGVKLLSENYLRFIQEQPPEPKKVTVENLNFFE